MEQTGLYDRPCKVLVMKCETPDVKLTAVGNMSGEMVAAVGNASDEMLVAAAAIP